MQFTFRKAVETKLQSDDTKVLLSTKTKVNDDKILEISC